MAVIRYFHPLKKPVPEILDFFLIYNLNKKVENTKRNIDLAKTFLPSVPFPVQNEETSENESKQTSSEQSADNDTDTAERD